MNTEAQASRPHSARPLSPHLSIWRFTPSMAASITHRFTGVALYGGALLLGLWVAALAFSPSLYAALSGFVRSPIGVVVVAGYAWSLAFHLLNGLRHLYWDMGRGLAPRTARMTSIAIYAGSVVIAAAAVWAGYAGMGA